MSAFPSLSVKNYRLVFKERLSENPKMITFEQSEKLRDKWAKKEVYIQLGDLSFSYQDIQKIEKVEIRSDNSEICSDPLGTVCGEAFERDGETFLPYERKRFLVADLAYVDSDFGFWKQGKWQKLQKYEITPCRAK
jgi:hypothetical protein